jgi:hypothetical protein
LGKKVRITVTVEKAAQLRTEARYREILSFLWSERRRITRKIERIQKTMAKRLAAQKAAFEIKKREYVEQLEAKKIAQEGTQ